MIWRKVAKVIRQSEVQARIAAATGKGFSDSRIALGIGADPN